MILLEPIWTTGWVAMVSLERGSVEGGNPGCMWFLEVGLRLGPGKICQAQSLERGGAWHISGGGR